MSTKLRNCNIGKRSQVRDFCIKRYLKQASLIEGKVMITVTNIHFYDIEGYGTQVLKILIRQKVKINLGSFQFPPLIDVLE